jgi:gag-polypeptide of LTR copia-type
VRRRSKSISEEAIENVFAKTCAKLTSDKMTIMVRALNVHQSPVKSKPKPVKVDLQSVEIKLDGSATYLSWSRRVRRVLEGKNLDGYITGEMVVSTKGSA